MSILSETEKAASEHTDQAGSCVLCGGTNGPIVIFENGYRGRSCSCGVVYIDPLPPPNAVDPVEDHHIDTYYSFPARLRLEWVSRFCPSGSLLEVGCGAGHFLARAKARGYRVAAVEPNPESAFAVARSLDIEVEQALIEDSKLPDNSYDVVFHVDLLSHFPDPVRALRRMANLVRRDGVVCFEVGVFGGLAPGWYRWVGQIGYPQHRWLYSEPAIRALLERAGLRVEAVRRFGLLPATLLSTLGNLSIRQKIARPSSDNGRAAPPTGFYRAYGWLQYVLRYWVGAIVPTVGPYVLFVAARPRQHDAAETLQH